MREYRRFTNINWGPLYNPDTGAHHCFATDTTHACELLPPTQHGLASTQVRVGDRWHWVTETPPYHGGICRAADKEGR